MRHGRIGIFGGTFDPVHEGHIEVASSVRSRLALDRVIFVPAYCPPHKTERPQADAWHRFAMLILATHQRDDLFVSTIELETRQAAYTVDTMKRLRESWGERAQFYFIIGADLFEEITTWKEYERLLTSCHFVVMTRPGYSLQADHLPVRVRQRIVDLRRTQGAVEETDQYHIYLCGDVSSPISSTAIREALGNGQSLTEALSPAVVAYIRKYRLYRNNDDAENDPKGFTEANNNRRRSLGCF
jgi:nicotinate-nucleotide adenylyltransferase